MREGRGAAEATPSSRKTNPTLQFRLGHASKPQSPSQEGLRSSQSRLFRLRLAQRGPASALGLRTQCKRCIAIFFVGKDSFAIYVPKAGYLGSP